MTTIWNASDESGVSLSNANLTMTVTGGFGSGVRSTSGPAAQTGLVYFEFQSLSISNSFNDCFGIATSSAAFSSGNGNGPGNVSVSGNGNIDGGSPNIGALSSGHTVCVAIDFDVMLIWFRLDGGNWNGSGTADPTLDKGGVDCSSITGTVFIFAEGFTAGDSATLALTSGSWSFTPPTGAREWDATDTSTCQYANPGGTGDRRTGANAIALTATGFTTGGGTATDILDGSLANSFWWQGGSSTTVLDFDFGKARVITGFRWYQDNGGSHGTWNWQGSNDNSTWTTIISNLTLGGAVKSSYLSTNTTGYRYYRLSPGSAQSTNSSPFDREIEFKIDSGIATVTGTWGSTEGTDTMSARGSVIGGSWHSTEAKDVIDFVSAPAGLLTATEAKDAMAFTGHPELSGVWSSIEITDAMTTVGLGSVATVFDTATASPGVDFQTLDLTIVNQQAFGQQVGARSNTSQRSGKLYAEFTTRLNANNSGVGIGNALATFTDWGNGTAVGPGNGPAANGAGCFAYNNGTIWVDGVWQSNWSGTSLNTWPNGSNVRVAIDLDNDLIWFSVNGGYWNGIAGANPAHGIASPRPPANQPQAASGGYDISAITADGPIYLWAELVNAYDTVTMNAGGSAFAYSIPSGFVAWDSVSPVSPAIQMDGYATNGTNGGPITTGTVTLSTTQANDVIVLGVSTGGFWNASLVDHVSSTSGLVWKRRNRRWQSGGYKDNAGHTDINGGLDTEIWWAHAPVALSGEVITVHMATGSLGGTGSISLLAFGVSGANYTTPWDAHTQAGGYVDNVGNLYYFPATSSLYTKATNALLFGFHSTTSTDTGTTQAPWTYVTVANASESAGYQSWLSLVYQVVEEPQFNTNVVAGVDVSGIGTCYTAQNIMFDSIVAFGETGTANEIVWFWDPNSVSNVISLSTGTTLQLSYSAVNYNLMVIIQVAIMSASGTGQVTSISESQGSLSTLGFERRSRKTTSTPLGPLAVEIWWGWMPMYTKPERAANDTITINTSGCAPGDIIGAVIMGLGGATGAWGLGDPFWDVDVSLPASNSNSSASPPPYATDISTTIPSDLVVAFTANNTRNEPGFTDPFVTLVQDYPRTIVPFLQLNSNAPALYTGFEFYYEPGLATNETAEFITDPEPTGWIVVADAIPVGPPQPPVGSMHTTDHQDKFTHTGDYSLIGIVGTGGWIVCPAIHGTTGMIEHADICGGTPNLGYSPFLGEGWLGWVPTHATWASTGGGDQMAFYGWVLGFGITGQLNAAGNKDRLAFSNRATVTGTMGAVEMKDRWASAGLVLPAGRVHPTTPYKRRLLIIT